MDTNTVTTGWFNKVKTIIGLDKLRITTDTIIQVCLYLGAGFLVGFLLKRLSTYLLAIVLALVVVLMLHQFDVLTLTVNLDKVQEFLGMQATGQTNIIVALFAWAKVHVAYVLSFTIGFLVGLKVS